MGDQLQTAESSKLYSKAHVDASNQFATNKGSLPKGIDRKREEIIELIREGFSPEEAFIRASS